ncbi:diguanylate cyclase [Aestuariicella sp. G3-2]|uniref:diguanylate cyclase n=1 Tax=Pseudomaricurvus albidus TaxID=2842452 RepID=UPI001C0C245B|nr:diguanylate cyclase [Aestuariicella albida]MBU3068793.1 diguanylate cyclase [Aestuariicella albida]
MKQNRLKSLSLKWRLLLTQGIILLPLLAATVAGFYLVNNVVMKDFKDVIHRYQDQVEPIRALQLAMLQVEIPLEEYLISGSLERMAEFRAARQEVEEKFSKLFVEFQTDPQLMPLLEGAQTQWNHIHPVVTDLLEAKELGESQRISAGLIRFDSLRGVAHDKLEAADRLITDIVDADLRDATLALERTEWIAAIALIVCLFLAAFGIYLFIKTIVDSIDRLIEGVERFAQGDRNHQIDIAVPPELSKVAGEFNQMIAIIRSSEERLEQQARTDKLTGLLNRIPYDEILSDAFQRFTRYNEGSALLALDIDHFKSINDTYGHDAGDEVLRKVAQILRGQTRSVDKAFRIGGEEFAIYLPQCDEAATRNTGERVRQAVEAMKVVVNEHTVKVTISVGYALTRASTDTPDKLKKAADQALYKAKEDGRNRVVGFDIS